MSASPPLSSVWFDGQSPCARACTLRLDGGQLVLDTEFGERRYPAHRVRWPERRSHGQREGILVGWMQSWRATLVAMVSTVALLVVAWVWGVPALSRGLAHAVPHSLEARVGQQALQQFERLYLKPSRLPQRERDELHRRFADLVGAGYSSGEAPPWQLSFHDASSLGANAFALPGGQIVVTDELVKLLWDKPNALLGVMAHELGHVQQHDGMDMLFRASLISGIAGVVMGDAGGFLATLPAALATQAYSREAERRADAHAAHLLQQAGISPAVMVTFFERLQRVNRSPARSKDDVGTRSVVRLPIAISSHPPDDERIRFFQPPRP